MKAFVAKSYGPPEVLEIAEVAKPTPGRNELLIKIYAVSVTVSDCIVRSGKINPLLWLPMRIFVGFGRPRKRILGFELAGKIESVGEDCHRYKTGDEIIAFTGRNFGAFAEYICLPENGKRLPDDAIIDFKPTNISFAEAATIPSRGSMALYYLRKGKLSQGQNVLIYGASGGVGSYAVQLARLMGAQVTGVCGPENQEFVLSLGADQVLDYTKPYREDDILYDLIFDAAGKSKKSPYKEMCKHQLKPNGKYISVDDGRPTATAEELEYLRKEIELNTLKPIVSKTFSFTDIVAAHCHVERGHKRGNVAVTVFEECQADN